MNIDAPTLSPVAVAGVTLRPEEAAFEAPVGVVFGPTDWGRYRWPLIGGLIGLGAGWRLLNLDPMWLYTGLIALVGGLGLGLWAAWSRGSMRRAGRRHLDSRFAAQPLDWRLDAVEVVQSGPFLRSAMPWTAFQHVIDGPAAFIFVLGPTAVLVLPKRLLSGDQAAGVRALIDHARDRGLIGATAAGLLPAWEDLRGD